MLWQSSTVHCCSLWIQSLWTSVCHSLISPHHQQLFPNNEQVPWVPGSPPDPWGHCWCPCENYCLLLPALHRWGILLFFSFFLSRKDVSPVVNFTANDWLSFPAIALLSLSTPFTPWKHISPIIFLAGFPFLVFLMIFYTFGSCSSRSVSLGFGLCLPTVDFPQLGYFLFPPFESVLPLHPLRCWPTRLRCCSWAFPGLHTCAEDPSVFK